MIDVRSVATATDSVGHVFIIDYNGDRIHMLDIDGRFLRYINNEICVIRDGEIIVGESKAGLVKRYVYGYCKPSV